jgi:hypothetical protein
MSIRFSCTFWALAAAMWAGRCNAAESPRWWADTRSIYASFDLSGAGGPLMKFPGDDIRKKLGTFENLPLLLDEARQLGCNCLYLVSYWEPNYENKGDYAIRADLGGPEAFRKGVEAVHAQGGRIILYLEAFIVTRTSDVGRGHGMAWCIKDAGGNPQTYYGRSRFYLMWPGEGSGWTEHICGIAERLARDYGVDGFHLDSYGIQWDVKDHDPRHKGSFNEGAVRLVKTMRQRLQKNRPDAVVMLEGCERTELLDVCDGGQIESAAWQYSPVKVLNEKPWVRDCTYKAFTSHYSMEEMDRILDMGYNLSLSPWWFVHHVEEKGFETMRKPMEDADDWLKRIRILWNWDNLLYINGAARPADVDLFELRRALERRRYVKPRPASFDTPAYRHAVERYEPLVRSLLEKNAPVKTQQQYLLERLTRIDQKVDEQRATQAITLETIAFDGGRVPDRPHPFLFLTQDTLRTARRRMQEPAFAEAVNRLNELADAAGGLALEPIDNAWWQQERDKPWQDTYPIIYEKTSRQPVRMVHPGWNTALRFAITGDKADAAAAKRILLHMADYTFEYEHYDVGMNYAVWGHMALGIHDILYDHFTPDERGRLDAFFTRMGRAVLRNDVYWIENNIGGGINNHLAWHKMIIGALGAFYNWPQGVEYALHGPRGMAPLLDDGLVDDGLWCESSLNYHFTAIVPMVYLANVLRNTGYSEDLYTLTTPGRRNLKQAYTSMFGTLFPDGSIPPIGDTYGIIRKLGDEFTYRYAQQAYQNSQMAWLLGRSPAHRPEALFVDANGVAAQAPPIASRLYPEHGYAFLRSRADNDYWDSDAWCAFLNFDKSGVHCHQDKLSLMLFACGRLLTPDVETVASAAHAFSAKVQRELNRSALSQNTVMVDYRDQKGTSHLLSLMEFRGTGDEQRATAVDAVGALYGGVRQSRTIILTPAGVLDVFQIAADRPHTLHWITHTLGTLEDLHASLPLQESTPLPPPGNWLHAFREAATDDTFQIDCREDNVHLRITVAAQPATKLIVCGYPKTDKPDTPLVPMILIERHAAATVYAVFYQAGRNDPDSLRLELITADPNRIVCRIHAPSGPREYGIPALR